MLEYLKSKWYALDANLKRHIISAATTFVSSFLMFLSAQIALGFPASWDLVGALALTAGRHAVKMAIEAYMRP